jgi:predicted alpha-1,2-mannosidase
MREYTLQKGTVDATNGGLGYVPNNRLCTNEMFATKYGDKLEQDSTDNDYQYALFFYDVNKEYIRDISLTLWQAGNLTIANTGYARLSVRKQDDTDFTEGSAFQYSWHVMQDVPGLIAAMGGREQFVKRLDGLFSAPSKTEGMGEVLDVTGLIGQYVHGNEPSHHVIYFYPQAGHPEKAAARIREVFDRFYLPKPDGLCGNEDCGQMSAWYIFSAMGFYPFNPCGGEYVIGAPQIPKVTINLPGGKKFTVIADNLSRERKFVKSVRLNGKEIKSWKIMHSDIIAGGELRFEMQDRF